MIGLGCWRVRRRLGAYRDRELSPERQARVEAHLAVCAGCQAEFRGLERLARWLPASVPEPPEAFWQAFWPGVRARLEPAPAPAWWERLLGPVLGHPRLALGSAVGAAVALLALLTPWTVERVLAPSPELAPVAEAMTVQSVEMSQPDSSVMLFTNDDKELTVIWVFGLDRT